MYFPGIPCLLLPLVFFPEPPAAPVDEEAILAPLVNPDAQVE